MEAIAVVAPRLRRPTPSRTDEAAELRSRASRLIVECDAYLAARGLRDRRCLVCRSPLAPSATHCDNCGVGARSDGSPVEIRNAGPVISIR